MITRKGNWRHAAYGMLGLPLAMAALPVYVQVPMYYTTLRGVGLAQLGLALFGARLFDTVQDPLLGHLIDRQRHSIGRSLVLAGLILALAFAGLWAPPLAGLPAAVWLAIMLILAYSAHSMINIAYLAWGARLPEPEPAAHRSTLSAAAWRGGAGLVGVIIAAVVPAAIMSGASQQLARGMATYSLLFALLLALALLALLLLAPVWRRPNATPGNWRTTWRRVRANGAFRRLLAPYFLNALSVSLPATLALFYIRDQLASPALSGAFLGCYFAAAACGLPAWSRIAQKVGALRAWRVGMGLSVAGFVGATQLGPGQAAAYTLVCVAAGAALGADLVLPPVLLAEAIGAEEGAAAYFAIFTLLGKLSLALAGLSLPLLSMLGYHPGTGAAALLALAYAGVPCLLKLLALVSSLQVRSAPRASLSPDSPGPP